MSDLVAIAVRLSPWEAHILRGRLEAEGIFAAVVGGDYEGSIVQVLVRDEDAALALEIKQNAERS
jgi:hypothetical protein